jgi:cell division initiation protein
MNFENIDSKEFGIQKKGYNINEVKEFLTDIAVEFEDYNRKILELENTIEELSQSLSDYKNIDKDLRNTLIFLKESERDTLIKTQDQVESMIKEAENKSQEIITVAEKDAKSTRDTLLFLKEQQEIFLKRLKIIIDNQEGMLQDFTKGDNSAELQKNMAEAAAFKAQAEINIDSILEKLL